MTNAAGVSLLPCLRRTGVSYLEDSRLALLRALARGTGEGRCSGVTFVTDQISMVEYS